MNFEEIQINGHAGTLHLRLWSPSVKPRALVLILHGYAEYGGRTGVHPSAVKSRAYRARRRLGALLREAVH